MWAYLRNKALVQVETYAVEGRRFSNLSNADLNAEWIRAFTAFCDAVTEESLQKEANDLEAELTLRGQGLPFDDVKDAFDRLTSEINSRMEEIAHDNPKRLDEINDEILDDIDELAKEIDASTKN